MGAYKMFSSRNLYKGRKKSVCSKREKKRWAIVVEKKKNYIFNLFFIQQFLFTYFFFI